MRPTRLNRTRLRVLAAIAASAFAGCDSVPTVPKTDPTISGVIRGPGTMGTLMIVAGNDSLSCALDRRAQVRTADADILWRSGGRARESDLKPGVPVSVWITGIVLDICPGIASARTVVIETQ